jgi:hypothetical protein
LEFPDFGVPKVEVQKLKIIDDFLKMVKTFFVAKKTIGGEICFYFIRILSILVTPVSRHVLVSILFITFMDVFK